jgi:putative sterol carrier protein
MSFDAIKNKIEGKLNKAAGLRGRFKFDFEDEGLIFVDTTVSPPVLSLEDVDADVTLMTSVATFEAIMEGRQDPTLAFMTGKLKIKGSMGLAMKLNSFLED